MKTKTPNHNRKKSKKNEDILRILWDNFKCTTFHIIGVPEGEEREQGIEKLSEKIMTETFLTW